MRFTFRAVIAGRMGGQTWPILTLIAPLLFLNSWKICMLQKLCLESRKTAKKCPSWELLVGRQLLSPPPNLHQDFLPQTLKAAAVHVCCTMQPWGILTQTHYTKNSQNLFFLSNYSEDWSCKVGVSPPSFVCHSHLFGHEIRGKFTKLLWDYFHFFYYYYIFNVLTERVCKVSGSLWRIEAWQ